MKVPFLVVCLLLSLPSALSADSSVFSTPALLGVLESALVNQSYNLMTLQSMFFPAKTAPPTSAGIFIDQCYVTVAEILESSTSEPAFSNCSDVCDGDVVNNGRYCLTTSYSIYLAGDYNSRLVNFISSDDVIDILETVEYVSFELFNAMTRSNLRYSYSQDPEAFVWIDLSIQQLEVMPSEYEFTDALEQLLSWAKYYARSYGRLTVPKEESDQMMVVDMLDIYPAYEPINWVSILGVYYAFNVLIAVVCIYFSPTVLQLLKDVPTRCDPTARKKVHSLFWAAVFVCGLINIVSFLLYTIFVNFVYILAFFLGPGLVVFFIELIFMWIIVKDFKMTDSVCCFHNRHFLRAIHTLAVCHILWFLHRVGCALLVSVFFIALGPAQAFATIAMAFLVVLVSVLYVAMNIYHLKRVSSVNKHCCKYVCKCFAGFLLYCSGVLCLVFFAIVYTHMIENSFDSSVLGNILLSFLTLLVIFVVVRIIWRSLKKLFPGMTGVLPTIEASGSLEKNGQTGHINLSENTPLISD